MKHQRYLKMLLSLVLLLWLVPLHAEQVFVQREAYRPAFAFRIKNTYHGANVNQKNIFTPDRKAQRILTKALEKGYLTFVLAKLDELNLPKELALIPLIESSYEKKALSHKGAGGLWQLMPATANDLGITQRERFELKASTRAALSHLQSLHAEFGNWMLAIAAYHAGSHRVKAALNVLAGRPIQQLNLPTETKAYVAEYMALQKQFTINFI